MKEIDDKIESQFYTSVAMENKIEEQTVSFCNKLNQIKAWRRDEDGIRCNN